MEELMKKGEQELSANETKIEEMFDETLKGFSVAELAVEEDYPVLPLRGQVAFPQATVSIEASRPMTVRAIELASETPDKLIFVLSQKEPKKQEIVPEDLYKVGTLVKVEKIYHTANGTLRMLGKGVKRAESVKVFIQNRAFYATAKELPLAQDIEDERAHKAHARVLSSLVEEVLVSTGKMPDKIAKEIDFEKDMQSAVYNTVGDMRVRVDVKQEILEGKTLLEQVRLLERCLNDEKEISDLEKKIATSVKKSIDKSQKEYFLHEQMKAIQKELGGDMEETEKYREQILQKHLPKSVEEKCLKEVDRLKKMQSASPEYTVITGYLDQVLELPWVEQTQDTEKLTECIKVLNADHYGLEKIKERIVEYLAVLKLTKSMKAPILCLVGPPGVGKTSIAQSVARALGRKFVRMSLGGVKDEAEIRGHRRTYIGAMPGRILYAMKNAGSINPVFLLDEIDKISSDMRGDPASALLEVLDPEQNVSFRDRFLEEPYDLSKVLFIATANTVESIPAPLLDRMELIRLSGYTQEEKVEIAKRYLVPKQVKANGLTKEDIRFSTDGIKAAIELYTLEAGVRTLERTVGTLCRKVAVRFATGQETTQVTIDRKKVIELLGAPKYLKDEKRNAPEVGAVTGLAWTAVGGTTLTVEATLLSGKGDLKLTGKLGDVMKESAQAALTFIRSKADELNIDKTLFEKNDVHVHVPEGATPKDGPSAGITIATALLSVFTGKKVRNDIAMTGEITLRGKVLAIGGLKEKALAARRQGIKQVIIPYDNKKDVEDIPEKIRNEITFIPVKHVTEVFEKVFL